jgi:arginyl-tRNA synthetase
MDFKKEIAKIVSKHTGAEEDLIFSLIEIPKDLSFGDYALPCFSFVKEFKKPPQQIAQHLSKIVFADWFISEYSGSYLNFKIKKEFFAHNILNNIKEPFVLKNKQNDVVGLESPSPNANKPLHLGHARNMLLGLSLKNIYEKVGRKVIWFDLVNDKGVHICKSMLAYKLKGKNMTPSSSNKKPDHFVGDFYVEFSKLVSKNPSLEDEAKKMLVLWEGKDASTLKLWKKMRDWWLRGVKKTYDSYGVCVDVQNFESDIYEEGKKIVLDGYKREIFEKDETGAIFINLEYEGFGKKYLLRSDGTSIYMTQDIYLAKKRFDDYKLDKFVYVVGSEQIYHFKTLFKILSKLGFDFANKCEHLAYGLIYLPDGKMKSREGNVVDADEFLEGLLSLAEVELKKRYSTLSKVELERRKKIIAVGALNFFILKYDSMKDFTYFSDKSLSFQGESGPYVQYTHARICSILRKKKHVNPDLSNLSLDLEKSLISKLGEYEDIILYASKNSKPSSIAIYLLELSQIFNSYYQEVPILKEDDSLVNARLFLIDKIRIILKDGLNLLGITAPEEM